MNTDSYKRGVNKLVAAIKLFAFLLVSLVVSDCNVNSSLDRKSGADSLSKKPLAYVNSEVRIKNTLVMELTSTYTKGDYDIYVSSPNNEEQSNKKYPVLVVLDAEVNFGGVCYIVQRLLKDKLIPEIYLIGIAYHGETDEDSYYSLRCKDYTPSVDKGFENVHRDYTAGSGGAENFVKFISQELFPYLEKKYPIAHSGRSIYGHSFGGLFGMHVLLNHSTLFDNYLLLSPSLWWNRRDIFNNKNLSASINPNKLKLYVATGEFEESMVDDHLKMVSILKQHNSNNLALKSEILDNETHRTIFGRGFTNGLRFLYSK